MAPETLNYGTNPLAVNFWLEKFSDYLAVNNIPTARKGMEMRNRLDSEWTTNLHSVVPDWTEASIEAITKEIKEDLLIQNPILARRSTLFQLNLNKGKTIRKFVNKIELQSKACHILSRLTREEVLVLISICRVSDSSRQDILRKFHIKNGNLQDFRTYAATIEARHWHVDRPRPIKKGTKK